MINQLIDYLLNQPTPPTAPLKVALTNSSLLTALGGSSVVVNLVDTRDQEGNPPYVRLFDSGTRRPEVAFLGGSYQEVQVMSVQCAAYGTTALEASIRADYLKRAVRGVIQLHKQSFFSSLQNIASDLGGSNATDQIINIYPVGGDGDPVISGPGKNATEPKWTAQANFKIEIRVFYSKATA